MREKVRIISEPNTGPPLKEIWAFISRDAEGRENVVGGNLPQFGVTPLITGNPRIFEIFKRYARAMRDAVEGKTDQTIHLLRFTEREEIEKW